MLLHRQEEIKPQTGQLKGAGCGRQTDLLLEERDASCKNHVISKNRRKTEHAGRRLRVMASRSGLMGTKELQENMRTRGSLRTTEGTWRGLLGKSVRRAARAGIHGSHGFGWGCPRRKGPGLGRLCCKPGSPGSSASASPDGTEELNHGFVSSAFQTSCNVLFSWSLPQNRNRKDNGIQLLTSSKLTTQFSRTFWTPAFLFVPQGLSF